MLTQLPNATLARVAGTTLADTAFMFVMGADGAPPWPDRVLEARVAFREPLDGELRLTGTESFAACCAANLLCRNSAGPCAPAVRERALGMIAEAVAATVAAALLGDPQAAVKVCRATVVTSAAAGRPAPSAGARRVLLRADGRHLVEIVVTARHEA